MNREKAKLALYLQRNMQLRDLIESKPETLVVMSDIEIETDCGTAGCLVGWIRMTKLLGKDNWPSRRYNYAWENIAEAMGWSSRQMARLCEPQSYLGLDAKNFKVVNQRLEPTKKAVLRRLDSFIKRLDAKLGSSAREAQRTGV